MAVGSLSWLPFQRQLVDWLREREPETWDWFAKRREDPDEQESIRLELLKRTLRLSPDDDPQWYDWLEQAKSRLEFDQEVTLYRARDVDGLNSGVVCLTEQCHIVLYGALEDSLQSNECIALLGHELGHAMLWSAEQGHLLIADQILSAWSLEATASSAWSETSRLLRLHNEVYCDRAAIVASTSLNDTVAALVKMETGVKRVEPESFLRQADEIISKEESSSQGESHPETYLRAQSLKWWVDEEPTVDKRIFRLLAGPEDIRALPLTTQPNWQKWTQDTILHLIKPAWRKTEMTLAHARLFWEGDLAESPDCSRDEIDEQISHASDSLRDYACFLLLDFATCDRQLQELALAQALQWTERWNCQERFSELVRRELRMRKSQLTSLNKQADQLLAKAERAPRTSDDKESSA